MAIKLMDTIETAGDFPVINAPSVGLPDGNRLDSVFNENGKLKEEVLPEGIGGSDPRLDNLLIEAETEVMAETNLVGFEINPPFGYAMIGRNFLPAFVSGETYIVLWDGERFTATAYDVSLEGYGDFVAVGNGSSLGYPGNGEPFVLLTNETSCGASAFDDPESAHKVGIWKVAIKVDESYLPESWVKAYVEEYIDEALRGDY